MRMPLDILPAGRSDVCPSQDCVSAVWCQDKNSVVRGLTSSLSDSQFVLTQCILGPVTKYKLL